MKHNEFISQIDEQRIIRAIGSAERKTSGEIRVYVSRKKRHDALTFARRRFEQLGMARTKHRNAVLLYIVPLTRQFAVVGDTGIDEKCGEEFWKQIVSAMSSQMRDGKFTEAIVDAVQTIGTILLRHFPAAGDDINELPDAVTGD